ncbi:Protease HtpX [compost metagenome]
MRSVHIFDYWRHVIANLALRLIHEIPLLRLLVAPTAIVIRMLSLVGRVGRRAGALVFRLFDTWASRRMEFAADRYAAEVAGPEAGIAFFEGVIGEWEPRFKGLLATHPRAADRAQRLREMRGRS